LYFPIQILVLLFIMKRKFNNDSLNN